MILDEIVGKRKEQLARELQRTDRETMRKLALQTEREVYSFPDALKSGRLSIIAEVGYLCRLSSGRAGSCL